MGRIVALYRATRAKSNDVPFEALDNDLFDVHGGRRWSCRNRQLRERRLVSMSCKKCDRQCWRLLEIRLGT